MTTQKVLVCSHGEIVQTGPWPDTRVWHTASRTFCNDRPDSPQTKLAAVTVIGDAR